MKIKLVMAAAWLGLLMWAEPASAEDPKPIFFTVGHHKSIKLSNARVDAILAEASKVLKKCNVVLKRQGPVGAFASSSAPAKIKDAAQRNAVNRENFDIKVVKLPIGFCRVKQPHMGCAWDPPPPPAEELPLRKSMIVVDLQSAKVAGMIWAHEFGHRTGLPHRSEAKALMSCSVPIDRARPEIDEHECECFRGGAGSCHDPIERPEKCAASQ